MDDSILIQPSVAPTLRSKQKNRYIPEDNSSNYVDLTSTNKWTLMVLGIIIVLLVLVIAYFIWDKNKKLPLEIYSQQQMPQQQMTQQQIAAQQVPQQNMIKQQIPKKQKSVTNHKEIVNKLDNETTALIARLSATSGDDQAAVRQRLVNDVEKMTN